MPLIHVIRRSYNDPRFEGLTFNDCRVYQSDPDQALACIKSTAASFEKVELISSEFVTDEEYQFMKNFRTLH